ncbi:hypothetical protein QTP70_011226 [Hemibagrus guttatus]|uniref:Reverse transcriptase domain-containing protein n=1 Tax=Hemibagrus guttatus TaxID=175788 RepID=A0AAE0QQ20_9TELE|nr:hypothetical protein QTP70_011226 [Hemibagrus guttatus]
MAVVVNPGLDRSAESAGPEHLPLQLDPGLPDWETSVSTSSTTTLSTGAPQGCVLSPLLFTLLTHNCAAMHSYIHIVKFADDTTVVGLISKNDESAHREEAYDAQCTDVMPFFCYSAITGKIQVLRVKVQSSQDMNEPAVQAAILEQKISARIKGKVYRTVVRPAMLYGLETVSLRKRQESELELPSASCLKLITFQEHCNTSVHSHGHSVVRSEALVGSEH